MRVSLIWNALLVFCANNWHSSSSFALWTRLEGLFSCLTHREAPLFLLSHLSNLIFEQLNIFHFVVLFSLFAILLLKIVFFIIVAVRSFTQTDPFFISKIIPIAFLLFRSLSILLIFCPLDSSKVSFRIVWVFNCNRFMSIVVLALSSLLIHILELDEQMLVRFVFLFGIGLIVVSLLGLSEHISSQNYLFRETPRHFNNISIFANIDRLLSLTSFALLVLFFLVRGIFALIIGYVDFVCEFDSKTASFNPWCFWFERYWTRL